MKLNKKNKIKRIRGHTLSLGQYPSRTGKEMKTEFIQIIVSLKKRAMKIYLA